MGFSKTLGLTAIFTAIVLALTGCVPDQSPVSPVAKKPQSTAPPLEQTPSGQASSPVAALPANAQEPNPAPLAGPGSSPQEQALIHSVELAYSSGVKNYHAGKLEAARRDFDRAVDMMLTSSFDLKHDPLFSDEFDRIVDAVNTLEMEALKQGNGFAPKIEPAPVDVANDVTFPVDPTIKAKAIAELQTTRSDLPLVINDPVASYINYFSSRGRGTLMRALERAGRYHDMISRVLAQEGVPQDLIYQAVAESGFQPQAVNPRSGAGGMWQFMPSGPYGLERNSWLDERFDPEKSTVAYARYMKELYAQLGDWYLAMAAYDWGAGNVQRSVQRTGYADFWELYRRNVLPQETKNYVPIIIAAAIMAKNPKQYGLESMTPDPPLLTDTVVTTSSVDLRLVADIVEAPLQEIVALNPSLMRMDTPSDASYELQLPAGSKDLYEKRIAEIPEDKRNLWRFHKVVPGETMAAIGREYHVSPSEIAFVNQIQPDDDLSATDSLVIPVPPAPSIGDPAHLTRYKVRRGDTLVTVADSFDVTVQQLRRWNHLHQNKLEPGRSIYVAEPAHISRSRRSRRTERPHSTMRSARSQPHSRPQRTAALAATKYRTAPARTRAAKAKDPE